MKLYTEEQVNFAMRYTTITKESYKEILKQLIPIELPSDEEIEIAANGNQEHYEGAMWLKYKYLTKTNNL